LNFSFKNLALRINSLKIEGIKIKIALQPL